jgi:hypothetical protein
MGTLATADVPPSSSQSLSPSLPISTVSLSLILVAVVALCLSLTVVVLWRRKKVERRAESEGERERGGGRPGVSSRPRSVRSSQRSISRSRSHSTSLAATSAVGGPRRPPPRDTHYVVGPLGAGRGGEGEREVGTYAMGDLDGGHVRYPAPQRVMS